MFIQWYHLKHENDQDSLRLQTKNQMHSHNEYHVRCQKLAFFLFLIYKHKNHNKVDINKKWGNLCITPLNLQIKLNQKKQYENKNS